MPVFLLPAAVFGWYLVIVLAVRYPIAIIIITLGSRDAAIAKVTDTISIYIHELVADTAVAVPITVTIPLLYLCRRNTDKQGENKDTH